MARKSKKSEWEKSLSLMSLDELYYILSAPDAYEAGYVQMAKEKLDDAEEMYRLKLAINKANSICTITTYYETDDKAQLAYVYCTTSILFRPMVHNLRQYLYTRLSNFFLAHDIINAEMLLLKEREQVGLVHSVIDVSPDDMPVC